MSAVSRRILPIYETPSLLAGELSLKRSIIHHAYLRVQQIALDLVAIHFRSSKGTCFVKKAKLQGAKGSKSRNEHGAHNSLNAGQSDNVVEKIREEFVENGVFTPNSKATMRAVFNWSPNTARQEMLENENFLTESLLWSNSKGERHHCTVLPSWMNLSVDCRMERIFRPIANEYYGKSVSGELSVEEILNEFIPQIQNYFNKASSECLFMAKTLKKVNQAEKKFLAMAKNWENQPFLTLSKSTQAIRLLYQIRDYYQLMQEGTLGAPATRRIPTVLGKIIQLLPADEPSYSKAIKSIVHASFTLLENDNDLRIRFLYRKAIWQNRKNRIEHYKNLSFGNKQSAEGTEIPPLEYLFLETPEELIAFANRRIRKPGLQTPSPLSGSRREDIPSPRVPITFKKAPVQLKF